MRLSNTYAQPTADINPHKGYRLAADFRVGLALLSPQVRNNTGQVFNCK